MSSSESDRFDRWAGAFEDEPVSRVLVELQRASYAILDVRPGERMLDVGCGTAAASRDATRCGVTAVGADRSPAMLLRARHLAGPDNTVPHLVCADAHALPFGDGTFAAVLCTAVLRHVANPDRALAEMRRVLARNGRLAIGDFTPALVPVTRRGRRRSAEPALAAAARDAGLIPLDVRSLPSLLGPYTVVLARPDRTSASARRPARR